MAAKKTKTTTATSDDRNKALTNALAQIEKDFGKGAIHDGWAMITAADSDYFLR